MSGDIEGNNAAPSGDVDSVRHEASKLTQSGNLKIDETAEADPNVEGSQEPIDMKKVGKVYKEDSKVDDIIKKEMGRLTKALDMQIDL